MPLHVHMIMKYLWVHASIYGRILYLWMRTHLLWLAWYFCQIWFDLLGVQSYKKGPNFASMGENQVQFLQNGVINFFLDGSQS